MTSMPRIQLYFSVWLYVFISKAKAYPPIALEQFTTPTYKIMKTFISTLLITLLGLGAFSQNLPQWQQMNVFATGDIGPIGSRNTGLEDENILIASQVSIPASDPAPITINNYLLIQELSKIDGSLLQEKAVYVPYFPNLEAKPSETTYLQFKKVVTVLASGLYVLRYDKHALLISL